MNRELMAEFLRAPIVVLTGVGKSGIVAELGASLLQSVGIPAVYVHATDLLHGSLGLLRRGGTIIGISHSGNTAETLDALHSASMMTESVAGVFIKTHLITGAPEAVISENAPHYFVHWYGIDKDGSIRGTIPTKSVAAQLDIINEWVCTIADSRTLDDVAAYHPNGALGEAYEGMF